MRNKIMAAVAVVAVMAMGLVAAGPADAGYRRVYGVERTVVHHGYSPSYRHMYVTYGDPYTYRYEPRGYYPYYNSGYWRSAAEARARRNYDQVLPPYYQAWGYPNRYYHHRAWHARHHGHTRHHHW
jgi:hypothetical protein